MSGRQANTDEALAGGTDLPPLWPAAMPDENGRQRLRESWLGGFARRIYGPIPDPPDAIDVRRTALPPESCERLVLTLHYRGRRAELDAALWLPPAARHPVPIVVGLCFLGPAGVLEGDAFPLDAQAVVHAPPELGLPDGRLAPHIRGVHRPRWPIRLLNQTGFGVLLSCYGSWVPDHPEHWRQGRVGRLLDLDGAPDGPGAISLWAWSILRLVDAARHVPEVDPGRISAAGFSRLGKAVLWAAASDPRLSGAFACCAGCLGPKPSRRRFGETIEDLARRYPHWVSERLLDAAPLPVEQHQLLASIAPRRLHLASASEDLWADPRGEYAGLVGALAAWTDAPRLPPASGPLVPGEIRRTGRAGWHLRPGGHALTPFDWRIALETLRAPYSGFGQTVLGLPDRPAVDP
jgi:hypothetical protein